MLKDIEQNGLAGFVLRFLVQTTELYPLPVWSWVGPQQEPTPRLCWSQALPVSSQALCRLQRVSTCQSALKPIRSGPILPESAESWLAHPNKSMRSLQRFTSGAG